MPKLLGLTQSGYCPASRFRFIQMIPHLENAGWNVDHRPNCPDRLWNSPLRWRPARGVHYRLGRGLMRINRARDLLEARNFDVIYVGRDLAAEGPIFQRAFRHVMPKVVYDLDDAIFVGKRGEKMVRWLCQNASWITPGNDYIADYARQFNDRITIIPTVIDTDACAVRSYKNSEPSKILRVGWSGSDQSITETLLPYLGMIYRLQQRVDFELVVITNTKPKLPIPELHWRFVPWTHETECVLESQFDIGIMPLKDDPFQKGKCALKLLQYMAAGLPTVASPVGVNATVVQHCQTGMLAKTETEWHQALEFLISSPDARATLGLAGRKRCEADYSIKRWLPVMLQIFAKVRQENQLAELPNS